MPGGFTIPRVDRTLPRADQDQIILDSGVPTKTDPFGERHIWTDRYTHLTVEFEPPCTRATLDRFSAIISPMAVALRRANFHVDHARELLQATAARLKWMLVEDVVDRQRLMAEARAERQRVEANWQLDANAFDVDLVRGDRAVHIQGNRLGAHTVNERWHQRAAIELMRMNMANRMIIDPMALHRHFDIDDPRYIRPQPVEETAEQRVERQAREHRARVEKEAADARALATLKEHLSAEQLESFERTNRFIVLVTQDPWRGRYQVEHTSRSFNVTHIKSGTTFCIKALGVPIADQTLTQKLLLENNPAEFFAKANVGHPDGRMTPPMQWRADGVAERPLNPWGVDMYPERIMVRRPPPYRPLDPHQYAVYGAIRVGEPAPTFVPIDGPPAAPPKRCPVPTQPGQFKLNIDDLKQPVGTALGVVLPTIIFLLFALALS